jgi:peptidoglycan-N-acetylglucosamine deacetylase
MLEGVYQSIRSVMFDIFFPSLLYLVVNSILLHGITVSIAITLDDFPTLTGKLFSRPEATQRFIQAAQEGDCTLAFFCVGRQGSSPTNRQCLQMANDAGHFLANHSMTHPTTSTISEKQFQEEVLGVDKLLRTYPMQRKWFRFPYLDYGFSAAKGGSIDKAEAARTFLKSLGYVDGYVSLFTMDYRVNAQLQKALAEGKRIDYEKLKRIYLDLLKSWCHHYIIEWRRAYPPVRTEGMTHTLLLHANELNTLYLADIISMLRAEGWKIVSPEQAFNSAHEVSFVEFPRLPRAPTMNTTTINEILAEAAVFT